jgi:hypothetical protein
MYPQYNNNNNIIIIIIIIKEFTPSPARSRVLGK